ncbi:MAG: 30S ribosomal protein S9 [Parcubacteria group bacterium]|nr:30S ribosomal protein S9 [Parcubacteria group bacterium]
MSEKTAQQEVKTDNRKYIYAIGRRKGAIATLRLFGKGSGKFVVNGMPLETYFTTAILRQVAVRPLALTNTADQYDGTISVKGGGVRGQSDAVRLAFARAIVETEPGYKLTVKKAGLLTRDPRVKERKKYGLKRARRAPQWAKR